MHQQKLLRHTIVASLLSISALAAQGTVTEGTPATAEPAAIEIKSKKNPGDLPYKGFLSQQADLLSYMPPEPLAIDMRLRVSFTSMDDTERDIYLPSTWSVAIVGDTVDHPVPVTRGGYFLLPRLEQALSERATIMFNTQTRKNILVDGQPADTVTRGHCKVLRFDAEKASVPGSAIALLGPVANVTLDTFN